MDTKFSVVQNSFPKFAEYGKVKCVFWDELKRKINP